MASDDNAAFFTQWLVEIPCIKNIVPTIQPSQERT